MSIELNKLHQGLTYEQYAAERGLRSSDLKLLKRSPAHYQSAITRPRKETDSLRFGKLFHSMIENGEEFLSNYIVKPKFDLRTKAGKESLELFNSDLKPGAIIVEEVWVDDLVGMCRSIKRHPIVSGLANDSVRETSVWAEDPETGVILKCRPDMISEKKFLIDFKSTDNASESKWISKWGHIFGTDGYFYNLQMAHYCHCLKAAGIVNGEFAMIIAVEKEHPYGIRVYPLDIGCLAQGEEFRANLTKLYAQCEAKGEWPSYPDEVVPVVPPQWVSLPGQEGWL